MENGILFKNAKEIVREAVYDKVSFDVFMMISNSDDIETVSDLQTVLDDETYAFVEQCVREYFAFMSIDIYVKYLVTMGKDPDDEYDDDFFIEW